MNDFEHPKKLVAEHARHSNRTARSIGVCGILLVVSRERHLPQPRARDERRSMGQHADAAGSGGHKVDLGAETPRTNTLEAAHSKIREHLRQWMRSQWPGLSPLGVLRRPEPLEAPNAGRTRAPGAF